MAPESKEDILYPAEIQSLDRDEVTAGFGLILTGLLDKIYIKAGELGAAEDATVTKAASNLSEKFLILGYGLRKSPKRTKLYQFNKRLKDTYSLSIDSIDEYVADKYRLVDMVERIGVGIQGNMIVNGLLTEKAKRLLAEMDSSPDEPSK